MKAIPSLDSGGLITNYHCTSACAHCLYACSPARPNHFMDEDTARILCRQIKKMGCHSVHVGGGEPFLEPEKLLRVLQVCSDENLGIDYVETNSSWFIDLPSALSILSAVRATGVHRLLVSMSPFHNEYIPFSKVKGVLDACEQSGMEVFPWIGDFYGDLDRFDDTKPHGLSEFKEAFGLGYVKNIPKRYWVRYAGRAATTYATMLQAMDAESIASLAQGGCTELFDTSHFHMDLYGNYIPGLCSGLAISAEDLGEYLPETKYPIITLLSGHGISGLLETAAAVHGFIPADRYISKCHLCQDIRRFLVVEKKWQVAELAPTGFYTGLKPA